MSAIDKIVAKRNKQINELGYTAEHDAGRGMELLAAGAAYFQMAIYQGNNPYRAPEVIPIPASWPWKESPKPDSMQGNLINAAACIAAGLDALNGETN